MRNRLHGEIAGSLSTLLVLVLTGCQGGGNGNEAGSGGAEASDSADAGPTNAGSGASAGNGGNGGGSAPATVTDGGTTTGGMMPGPMSTDGGTTANMMPMNMTTPPRMAFPMSTPTDPTGATSMEGSPCDASFPCPDTLVCHAETAASRGACARPCTGDGDCTTDEVCGTYDGVQGICVGLVGAWDFFSLPDLTICEDNLVAIAIADVPPTGWCIPVCELPDAPAPAGATDFLMTCSGTDTCSDVLGLASADGSRLGACATTVARGEVCDELLGMLCEDQLNDLCTPVDPDNLDGELRCHQYCDDVTPCDEGTCTPLVIDGQELFSHCL